MSLAHCLFDTMDRLSNFHRRKQSINMFSGCAKIPWSWAQKSQNFEEHTTGTQITYKVGVIL